MRSGRRSSTLIRAGFDEAGLGPTLGPLVVAGFATRRGGDLRSGAGDSGADPSPIDDLLGPLAAAVGPPGAREGRLEVGDSKKIHTGKRKLERIERTALATVAWVHGRTPGTVAELLALVGVPAFELAEDRRAPWWSMLDERLPVAVDPASLAVATTRLREAALAAEVTPLWYRADVIGAARINRELGLEEARDGTKNTWATHAVLRLAKLAHDELGPDHGGGLSCWCDKAGGRQAYVEPLERAFETPTIEIVGERRDRSVYRIGPGPGVEIGFLMGGDRLDPRISWASILAKYMRELIMRAFNRYMVARLPELRPTAGYPEDAKRFIAALEAGLGPKLGVPRADWIRSK